MPDLAGKICSNANSKQSVLFHVVFSVHAVDIYVEKGVCLSACIECVLLVWLEIIFHGMITDTGTFMECDGSCR